MTKIKISELTGLVEDIKIGTKADGTCYAPAEVCEIVNISSYLSDKLVREGELEDAREKIQGLVVDGGVFNRLEAAADLQLERAARAEVARTEREEMVGKHRSSSPSGKLEAKRPPTGATSPPASTPPRYLLIPLGLRHEPVGEKPPDEHIVTAIVDLDSDRPYKFKIFDSSCIVGSVYYKHRGYDACLTNHKSSITQYTGRINTEQIQLEFGDCSFWTEAFIDYMSKDNNIGKYMEGVDISSVESAKSFDVETLQGLEAIHGALAATARNPALGIEESKNFCSDYREPKYTRHKGARAPQPTSLTIGPEPAVPAEPLEGLELESGFSPEHGSSDTAYEEKMIGRDYVVDAFRDSVVLGKMSTRVKDRRATGMSSKQYSGDARS